MTYKRDVLYWYLCLGWCN